MLVLCALLTQRALLWPPPSVDSKGSATLPAATSASPSFRNPLGIPAGRAPNLPSVRVTPAAEVDRSIYGGKGDKVHLGGFTDIDMQGISPAVWRHAVANWTVHSVMDVGCGRGVSTAWFATHGLRTECVEGSHDAIEQTMVPDRSILTEHDFSRGPWWPERTFDLVWSVEFLEHVSLQFQFNYVQVFRKAAILMVSHSNWGGWHHVEVHDDEWWIDKYEAYGFRYSEKRTKELRDVAQQEASGGKEILPANGKRFAAQHVRSTMLVFLNPVVAALPEHAHLFGEFGCYGGRRAGKGRAAVNKVHAECGTTRGKSGKGKQNVLETPLDPAFYPLTLTEDQDRAWYEIVRANLGSPEPGNSTNENGPTNRRN